jgi:hypothetical protein
MTVYRHQKKWRYDFSKHGVRHRQAGFPTKEAARMAEAEARKNLRKINTDFIKLCEKRLDDLKLKRTDKHFNENETLLNNLILRWAEKKEITKSDVQEYLNEVAAGGLTFAVAVGNKGVVLRKRLDPITAVEDPLSLPVSLELPQNYPNPFNPSTEIAYSTPAPGEARLVVYDVLGREVRTLVNGMVGAGSHRVTLSADGLPGGTLFCRLEFGGSSLTRRMVLLK